MRFLNALLFSFFGIAAIFMVTAAIGVCVYLEFNSHNLREFLFFSGAAVGDLALAVLAYDRLRRSE